MFQVKCNLNTLQQLDTRTVDVAMAKLSSIKEDNKIIGWFSSFVLIVFTVMSAYGIVLNNTLCVSKLNISIYILVWGIILLSMIYVLFKLSNDRRTAIFFYELLKSIEKER